MCPHDRMESELVPMQSLPVWSGGQIGIQSNRCSAGRKFQVTMQSNKTQPTSNQNQPATHRVALAGQMHGVVHAGLPVGRLSLIFLFLF